MDGIELTDGGFFCELNGVRHFVRTPRLDDARRIALDGAGGGQGAAARACDEQDVAIAGDGDAVVAGDGGAAVASEGSAAEIGVRGAAVADGPCAVRAGAATPLVLLHGFMQDSRAWGARLLEELSQDRPVYTLDFAGFGRSDAPAGALAYRAEETVAAVRDLVELVGADGRAHLMGYSMGGRVALMFATAHPDRASSLVLESAGLGPETPEARAALNARDAAWVERLRTGSIEAFVDYWEGLPLFASQQGMDDEARALLRQVRLSCDPAVLARCIQGSGQHAMPSLTDAVRRLRMPILYAAGMADEKYTKVAVKLAARGCAVCTLMPCGHNVHLERPAMLCGHVRPFLALCDARGCSAAGARE